MQNSDEMHSDGSETGLSDLEEESEELDDTEVEEDEEEESSGNRVRINGL